MKIRNWLKKMFTIRWSSGDVVVLNGAERPTSLELIVIEHVHWAAPGRIPETLQNKYGHTLPGKTTRPGRAALPVEGAGEKLSQLSEGESGV